MEQYMIYSSLCDDVWLKGIKGASGEVGVPGFPGRKGEIGEAGIPGRAGEIVFCLFMFC